MNEQLALWLLIQIFDSDKEVNWVAMDSNKLWHGFKIRPVILNFKRYKDRILVDVEALMTWIVYDESFDSTDKIELGKNSSVCDDELNPRNTCFSLEEVKKAANLKII